MLHKIDLCVNNFYGITSLFDQISDEGSDACSICDQISRFIYDRSIEIINSSEYVLEKDNMKESNNLMETVINIKVELGTCEFGQKMGYLLAQLYLMLKVAFQLSSDASDLSSDIGMVECTNNNDTNIDESKKNDEVKITIKK